MSASEVLAFLRENWVVMSGIVLLVFGMWKYFDGRKRELAWKRTQFLVEQLKYLHSDEDMNQVLQILDGRHLELSVTAIFGSDQTLDQDRRARLLIAFEKFLDFIHLLAYAVFEARTISMEEVDSCAGWYVQKIGKFEELVKWCENNGYHSVVRLSLELSRSSK